MLRRLYALMAVLASIATASSFTAAAADATTHRPNVRLTMTSPYDGGPSGNASTSVTLEYKLGRHWHKDCQPSVCGSFVFNLDGTLTLRLARHERFSHGVKRYENYSEINQTSYHGHRLAEQSRGKVLTWVVAYAYVP